jgi:hypothetical protein
MKLRVILVCTLLLLAAVPSFALPLCAHCNEQNRCESSPGDFERCFSGPGYCYTTSDRCSIPSAASTVLTDYKVASVEISGPAQDCVAAPSAVTEASTSMSTPTLKTTELK